MNVAIIPARSGSKGVPNKNFTKLWGKSLIGWAADCAKETGLFDAVLLSTDSELYAQEGLKYGCQVPYLRPVALSSDSSNIVHVLQDLIEKLPTSNEWKTLVLLEPTCPLRTPDMVKRCFTVATESELTHSAITVSEVPVKYHPLKQFMLAKSGSLDFFAQASKMVVNRQELMKSYIRNGAAYVINKNSFVHKGTIIDSSSLPCICSDFLINIDSIEDTENLSKYEITHSAPW